MCRFRLSGIPVELFVGRQDPLQSAGYRHMKVEYRLLELFGEGLRSKVHRLRRQGMKTEPAFAQALGLGGDPYRALLGLENVPDEELAGLYPPDGRG